MKQNVNFSTYPKNALDVTVNCCKIRDNVFALFAAFFLICCARIYGEKKSKVLRKA